MSLPYSNDLRERVIILIKNGTPVKEAVEIFKVKKSTIYNWLKRERETGSFKAYDRNQGRKGNLTKEQIEEIKLVIESKPDITLQELKETLQLEISISALCRIINNKLKLRYKKKSIWKRTIKERCYKETQ